MPASDISVIIQLTEKIPETQDILAFSNKSLYTRLDIFITEKKTAYLNIFFSFYFTTGSKL
jgi:hypothetical protein